ncbi:hypothetical protein Y032_0004g1766 [Ancylostoma ceylanicum]|uniref:Uncharacterized protein n=1 Tax=Ancylostoma ceylanicum TaxID=53326 RepID=A0A016VUP9_9BILA|nr:hypothetical protein Y032_0004g1766 [Ancylostoma ceylanicum]
MKISKLLLGWAVPSTAKPTAGSVFRRSLAVSETTAMHGLAKVHEVLHGIQMGTVTIQSAGDISKAFRQGSRWCY